MTDPTRLAPPSHKVSPQLIEELRVKDVAQALVIVEPQSVLAARDGFAAQAVDIERHFVADERSWSAALARLIGGRSAGLGGRRRDSRKAPPPAAQRFPELGVILGDLHAAGVEALSRDANVRYIASSLGISLVRPTRVAAAGALQQTTWGIKALGADRLWAQKITGAGIRVGHIDTGADGAHPALKGAIKGFLLTDDGGFPVKGAKAQDTGEHGTHTAATIAGRAVAGRSVGVAPAAELYCAAVIEGGNTVARILAGLDWTVRNGARIVSMSLGIRGYHDDFYELMRALRARGVLPVVAVGNEGAGTSRSPGNYDLVLSVGASDESGHVAAFSSSDTFTQPVARQVPDLVAPGVGVISAKAGGGYLAMDGSSMATPHVAGLAALLWSAQPDATAEQIEAAIYGSCKAGVDGTLRGGRGLPNAPRALALLTGQPPLPERTATARKKARATPKAKVIRKVKKHLKGVTRRFKAARNVTR